MGSSEELSPVLVLAREVESPDRAVIATDSDGVVVYWGRGAEVLYGWTEAEALGRNILDITPGDLSRSEAQNIMLALTRGEPWFGEFLVQAKEGARFMVHVSDVPVHDSNSRLVGIVGISRRASYLTSR